MFWKFLIFSSKIAISTLYNPVIFHLLCCSENMEDLREGTQSVHYERYRKAKLAEMGFAQRDETDQPVR